MAGKKKKKISANPARGFATVSIPSKPKDAITDPEISSGAESDRPKSVQVQSKESNTTVPASQEADIAKMTPEQLEAHLEREELSLFVDKEAVAVKSHAERYALKVQNERRLMRSQADKAFISAVMTDLLEEILRTESGFDPKILDNAHDSDADEMETLLKLWTLQEVLVHLNMPCINDALAYALSCRFHSRKMTVGQVSGLTEAFEWYALHSIARDLPDYENGKQIATVEQVTVEEEKVSSDESARLDNGDFETNNHNHTNPIHELPPEFDSSGSEDTDEDNDPAMLVERWLKLQTLNYKLEGYREAANYDRQMRKSNERLAKISRDPLFDARSAGEQWNATRREMDIQTAREKKKNNENLKHDDLQNTIIPAAEDIEPDFMLGDMFDTELSPSTEDRNSPSSIKIKDFGTWSGVHPRRILQDMCSKGLELKSLKLTPLQVTSYSARLRLTLSWAPGKAVGDAVNLCVPQGIHFDSHPHIWSFTMDTLAAVNSSQAEALLCTLALFMLDNDGHSTNKTSNLLPKSWREMYTDLSKSLQEIRRKRDVENVSFLREIIRSTSSRKDSLSIRPSKQGNTEMQRRKPVSQTTFSQERLPIEKAVELWQSRVNRPAFQKMQPSRTNLPVFAYKESILRASEQNQIILVCADTGAGKSTQIPSYVLEHGLSHGHDLRVLVTQPRRISAISIARRVSEEMGEGSDHLGTSRSLVGYAIRLESKISASTRLTFATTGVLLRMLQDSFNLDQYDYLILDEVHERTMDLDLIFIALQQLQKRRTDLRIILMSATVETNKFSAYFNNCAVLQIPGRTFPVEVGFLEDAIEETLGLLENSEESRNQDDSPAGSDTDEGGSANEYVLSMKQYSSPTIKLLKEYDHKRIDYQLILKLATAIATYPKYEQYSTAILIFMPGLAEIRRLSNLLTTAKTFSQQWVIHMLHSSFSTAELEQAFLRSPPGIRKIVIATNIAETGITIPDVTAVIDTCKEKVMRFDERRQLSRLTEGLISQSSARQRRGRAARVQNGLCFHLIPKYYHDQKLPAQSTPEMLRLSLQQSLLRIKIWDFGSIEEVLSAAIDPPTSKNIHRAISKLKDVAAIDSLERLTALGKLLAKLPLDVALGKLAIYGVLFQCLDAAVTIIAIISVKSIFTESRTARDYAQTSFFSHDSDLVTTYKIYCGWKHACKAGIGYQFCRNQHLSYPQLLQVDEQKIQLLVYLSDAGLLYLDQHESYALNHARNSRKSMVEFEIPVRYTRLNEEDIVAGALAVAFHPKILRRESGSRYRNVYTNQHLQLAPPSKEKILGYITPKWLCYMEAIQVKSGKLDVLNSSRITEILMTALLGEADFNLFAGIITIDNGNIRISLRHWREMLAFKRLRERSRKIIDAFLTDPSIIANSDYVKWSDLLAKILRKGSQSGTILSHDKLSGEA